MIASTRNRTVVDRMLGAALLEADVLEEAARAPSLRTQAAMIVMATSVAAGVGSISGGMVGFVAGTVGALIGWIAFAIGSYWVAVKRFGVTRTYDNLSATVRVLGLASAPRLFLVLAITPGIGVLVGLAVHAWVFIVAVAAVRTALDLEFRPAVSSVAGGWLPMLALWLLVAVLT